MRDTKGGFDFIAYGHKTIFFLFLNVCTGPTLFCEQKNEGKQLFMWPRNAHGLNEITIFFCTLIKLPKLIICTKTARNLLQRINVHLAQSFFLCRFPSYVLFYVYMAKFESQHIKCDQFLSSNKKKM